MYIEGKTKRVARMLTQTNQHTYSYTHTYKPTLPSLHTYKHTRSHTVCCNEIVQQDRVLMLEL